MIRKWKDSLKHRWLALPRWAQHLNLRSEKTEPVVVIYFPGGIGDYLLFRPCLASLVTSKKFTNHHFVLLGNVLWKDWFDHFDAHHFERAIWLDPQRCQRRVGHRYQIMTQVNSLRAEHVLVPSFSRHPYIHDDFLRGLDMPYKWGTRGDLSKLSRLEDLNDSAFSHIFEVKHILGAEPCFEWEYYQAWTMWLTGETITSFDSHVNLEKTNSKFDSAPYMVCFIGGSSSAKKWSTDRWVTLIQKLLYHTDLRVMICGGGEDVEQASMITSALTSDDVVNVCGELTLVEFASVLKDARCFIGHEGCAQHIAHAVGLNRQVILYNGLHFGRFIPYPQDFSEHQMLVLHPLIMSDPMRYRKESQTATEITLSMNEISVDMVWEAFVKAMDVRSDDRYQP